jgi:hypothetical protein
MRPVSFQSPVSSERFANHAERGIELSTEEYESGDGENRDERKNECVLREALSYVAVKGREHNASFRRRRLAFVATSGGRFSDMARYLTVPGVASA